MGTEPGAGAGVPQWKAAAQTAALAAAYVVTAKLGLTLDAVSGVATTVWPPTGLALAALLLYGYRLWPAVALGALLANLDAGVPWAGALGIAAGNTLEAVAGAWLLKEAGGFHPALDRLRDVAALAVLAALVSTLISATVGTTSARLAGIVPPGSYGTAWRSWWVGDALGDLVVAPLLLTWASSPTLDRPRRTWEALAVMAGLAVTAGAVFGDWFTPKGRLFDQPYIIFPFLIWTAVRFGSRGAASATFVASAVAILGTSLGHGPFAGAALGESLFVLQLFMGVAAATGLLLAAAVSERDRAEQEARRLNEELEDRVVQRTAELARAIRDLEAYNYSIAHDLRAPLRSMDGHVHVLLERFAAALGEEGSQRLGRLRASVSRMASLIEGLLNLSRLSVAGMRREKVDLSAMARKIAEELRESDPRRAANFTIADGIFVEGDHVLLGVVVWNLLDNAWKFTARRLQAEIEFGARSNDGRTVCFVRDNGAGFDMAHGGKLYRPFQRLHARAEFPGSGIGLAMVQRVVERHGGKVWAEGEADKGATFFFALGKGGDDGQA